MRFKPSKILLIQLRQVGDVLLQAPLVKALKEKWPEAHLDYMVETYSAAAARGIPGVDGLFQVPRKLKPKGLWKLRSELRSKKYDLVVDGQGNQKTASYSWFTGAPRRIGFKPPWTKPHLRICYTDLVTRRTQPGYTCHYRLDLLRPLGIETDDVSLGYIPLEPLVQQVKAWYASKAPASASWIGLSPGGRIPLKSWPLENYVAVGKTLTERGKNILIVFGPGEKEVAQELLEKLGAQAHLEESHSYEEHAAFLSQLEGIVLNDGGNLHLAVGLNVPSVCLFGPTDPAVWAAPDTSRHRALRGPCTCTPAGVHECVPKKCLVATSPEEVLRHLDAITGASSQPV